MKKFLNLLVVVGFIISIANLAFAEQNYRLENVVIFSRHNVRSPTVSGSKILTQITSHKWKWTAKPGELSLRGGLLETALGEYFRKYLESENFLPDNYSPAEGEVKFYANSRNRTMATAKYFSAGIFPVANVEVGHKYKIEGKDETFLTDFPSDDQDYREKVLEQICTENNVKNLSEIGEKFNAEIATVEKILDFKNSPYAKEKNISAFSRKDFGMKLEKGKDTGFKGDMATVHAAIDGLLMQMYELPYTYQKSFGRKISDKEFAQIMKLHRFGVKTIHGTPEMAPDLAKPILEFLSEEIAANRKFTFICGHDSNLTAMFTTLGVEDYETLPNSLEIIPIGSKFVIEKRIGDDGKEYAKTYLLYQTFDQIKNLEILSLENPPQTYALKFKGLQTNSDGLYLYEDFVKLLNSKIK